MEREVGEIHFSTSAPFPAQMDAAFAYYHDHRTELDAQIERSAQDYERLSADAGESPIQKRLPEHLAKLRRAECRGPAVLLADVALTE